MTAKFYAILTNQGAAMLANAAALGTKLNLTQMAVGDANGALPVPDPAQTKLINQKRIAPLNMLSIDPQNASQIVAEQVIPENEGGFWIREIGLFDDGGVLIAVANCPETYKPQLQEGSGRTQTIRMALIVSSTAAVTLKIDPSVVLATRQYVDEKVIEVKAYADDLMKKHVAAENPHTQYLQSKNNLSEVADKAKARGSLGLGSAALKNTGTSGDAVPLANGANTWSAKQTFSGGAQGALTGNASTATKLQTARKIGGVSFDGTEDISINTLLLNFGLKGIINGMDSVIHIPALISGKPGSYVIQSQQISTTSSEGTVIFHEAFNNACLIIIAVDYASSVIDNSRVRFNIPTKTQCEWFGQNMSPSPTPTSPSSWAWLAIGY